jgi:hypothetical protein
MSPHSDHDKQQVHLRLLARLREQAQDIRRLTSGLDETALATRTVPEKWSLKELVCHLLSVQRVFRGRIDRMIAEDRPKIAKFDVDNDPEFHTLMKQPASETLAALMNERDTLVTSLEALAPAGCHRAGQHPEFPHVDVHFQVEYMTHHEAHHIYQMLQRRIPLGKIPH